MPRLTGCLCPNAWRGSVDGTEMPLCRSACISGQYGPVNPVTAVDQHFNTVSTSVLGSYSHKHGVRVCRKEHCDDYIVYSLLCAGSFLQVALLLSSCLPSASITKYTAWAKWVAIIRPWLVKTLASGESCDIFVDVNRRYGWSIV